MIYVDPIPMTDAALLTGTNTPEPATGEVVWTSSASHALGDLRIRTQTHRVYRCVQAHGSRTTFPENDPQYWLDYAPTLRWAPFDYYAGTVNAATANDLTYVLTGRYVNTIWLDGLLGASVSVSVKDAVGGTIVFNQTVTLKRAATGYWNYAYGQRYFERTIMIDGLPIYPSAEITITISAASGSTRRLGTLVIGKALSLVLGGWGGTLWGARAVPRTFSSRTISADGTFRIVPRGTAVDLECNVTIKIEYADLVVEALTGLMGRPVVWIATKSNNFKGLRTFGFAQKPSISYEPGRTEISNYIEGIVST